MSTIEHTRTDPDLPARALSAIPGGVNSGQRRVPGLEATIVAGTDGATFTDGEGRTYVDFHAAFGPPLLGHNDPDVDRAVRETIGRLDLMGVAVTEVEVELAEEIIDAVPSVEQLILTSTGSEATFHALRLARAVTGRRHVIKFQGCYHGWHDAVSTNIISPPEKMGRKDPVSDGILPEVLDATLVCQFNDLESVRTALEQHDVAAIIVEPIPHNIGAVLPAEGFHRGLRELATEHGALLVFDEVITGFRHAVGGWQEIEQITPDLTTFGKAMANGYPVAALGGRADLLQELSSNPGGRAFFAGTYNGHPAMAAAALATVRKLRAQPVHEHVFRLGQRARDELTALYATLGVPAVVSGYGSVFVTYFQDGPIEHYGDLLRNDAELFVGYRRELMQEGVFELPLNLKRSCVSYAHTDADVDRLLTATEAAVTRVLAERR